MRSFQKKKAYKVTHPEKKEEGSVSLSNKTRLIAMFAPLSSTEAAMTVLISYICLPPKLVNKDIS